MRKIFSLVVLTLVMSAYMFPISFTFLPEAVNSKMIVAGFGVLALAFDSLKRRSLEISRQTLVSAVFALVFSVWCLFCIIAGNSSDTAYASYIVSFLTWMMGAYGVCVFLRLDGGQAGFNTIAKYLAYAAVFQCISAVLIDNSAAFSNFVDKIMRGGAYYREHHRLYGMGAALDPAGIRFAAILVIIAQSFAANSRSEGRNSYQPVNMVCFTIISIIGAVISRTTLIGTGLGLAYIGISLFRLRKGGFITTRILELYAIFILVLLALTTAIVFMYNSSPVFNGYLRFGFEAFFNWVETGEFRTSSTDHLSTMWIWPDDPRTWLIGRGTFGVFDNYTDIGYCNFIFYCGLVGMVLFAFFFIYNHFALSRKFRGFTLCSLLLTAITFIVWMKVTTDIFFIDALLLCAAPDLAGEETKEKEA